jgi:hypothetical protein
MATYAEFEAWQSSGRDPWAAAQRNDIDATDSQPEPEFGVQFIGDDPLPPRPPELGTFLRGLT